MKKFLLPLLATIITAGIITFVACDKNENITENAGRRTLSMVHSKPVVLAVIEQPKDNPSPEMSFNIDSVETLVNHFLCENYDSNIIFNDIFIYEKNPVSPDVEPYLAISITDIKNGETMTGFIQISKRIARESDVVTYYATGEEKIKVKCKGKNCDGCTLNADRTGCTPCKNEGGKCKSKATYSSGSSLWDAIEKIAGKIVDIIKAVKS